MAKDDKKSPPVRTKTNQSLKQQIGDLFGPEIVTTNALSQFILDKFLEADINEKDSLETIRDKTEFDAGSLDKFLKYLGNYFNLVRQKNESWLDFFRRAAITLHEQFPEVSDSITNSTVPANLEELVAELDAHQQLVDEIKAETKLDILEKYSSPSQVSQYIINLLENLEKELESVKPDLSPEIEQDIILARIRGDPETFEENLARANFSSEQKSDLKAKIDPEIAKARLMPKISAESPKNLRTDPFALANISSKLNERQAKTLQNAAKEAEIEIPYSKAVNVGALSLTAVKEEEKRDLEKIVEQITTNREDTSTILNRLASERAILLQQVPAEESVKQRLINNQVSQQRAEKLAQEAVFDKRQTLQEKIKEVVPNIDQDTKTNIIAAALADDTEKVRQVVGQIEGLSATACEKLIEDSTAVSNQFLAAQATIKDRVLNLPEKIQVPDRFRQKLIEHPQVVDTISTLIVAEASQNVAKENITAQITAPTAIAMSANNLKVEEGEEKAINQIVAGIDKSTLRMVALSEDKYFQASNLRLEKMFRLYLTNQLDITDPETLNLFSNFWAIKTNETSQQFLNLKNEEGVALSSALKTLPTGDPAEIASHLNADGDPFTAAAVAAQMTEIPPDQLQEKLLAWEKFSQYLEETGRAELINQNKLLATLRTWYGKDGVGELVYNSRLYHIYHNLRQVFSPITGFVQNQIKSPLIQRLGRTSIGKGVTLAFNRGKTFLQEKFFAPIKKWAIEKVGQKLAEKGIEIAVGEGATAAIAGALGIPSGGVSVLLWVGYEALKAGYSLIKKALKAIGLEKAVNKFNELTSFGLAKNLDKAVDKVLFFLPEFARDAVKFFNRIFEGIAEVSIIGTLVVPAIVGVFIFLFFYQLFVQSPINLTMAPPVTERGGSASDILPPGYNPLQVKDISKEDCDAISSNKAKIACLTHVVGKQCFNTDNPTVTSSNVDAFNQCLRDAEFDDGTTFAEIAGQSALDHMTSALQRSANNHTFLQCVGFKYGIEPGITVGGGLQNAVMYINNHECTEVSPRSGSNIVFGPGSNCPTSDPVQANSMCGSNISCCGHIGIVTEVNGGLVNFVSAWGDDGLIDISQVPDVQGAVYLNCD